MAIVYTQADLDNLKDALLTGATEVRIGDRIIVYRSQAEILQLIKLVQSQLSSSTSSSASLVQAKYKKGQC